MSEEDKGEATVQELQDGEAEDEGALEQPKSKPHNFDKGLSKLQQKLSQLEKRTEEKLGELLDKFDSKANPTSAESNAASKVEDFLEGRDPDDVPSMGDIQKLVQAVQSSNKGPDSTAIAKAVQEAVQPLLMAKQKSDEDAYWAKFFQAHPTLDQPMVDELWGEAAEMADDDGGSDAAIEAATKAHFRHLVKSKERSLKRKKADTLSTDSPSSPDGATSVDNGARTPSDVSKSRMQLYADADPDGRL